MEPIGILINFLIITGSINAIFTLYPPLGNKVQKLAWSTWPNLNPDMQGLFDMLSRKLLTIDEFYEKARETGFDENTALRMFTASRNLLNAYDYINLFRRNEIDKGLLFNKLEQLKFTEEESKLMLKASEYYPTPQDLILFAVREVYSPDVTSKYGHFEDLPDKFITEGAKVGLSRTQAENYWAAHWRLPSATQGFEMLHRGLINREDLITLLRSLDILPFWRDKIVELSYNVPTRVDVRRMYSMGVYNQEAVYNNYLKLGYNAKDAKDLTDFTTIYENQEKQGITRDNVIKAYLKDIISKEDMENYLYSLKYDEDTVSFLLNQAEYEKSLQSFDSMESELKLQYKQGLIDYTGAKEFMVKNGFPTTLMNKILTTMVETKSQKEKLASRTDLERWYEKNIISKLEYAESMKNLGYGEDIITNYLTEIERDKGDIKVKLLTIKQYQTWYSQGVITEAKFRGLATKMGYRKEDIDRLVNDSKKMGAKE